MSSVTLTRDVNVGIITLQNPPVNGLSFAVRRGLADCVNEAIAEKSIEAIVITGAGTMFCAGADIRESGTSIPPGVPHLPHVINKIEDSPHPVVAAIHGVAAGGGLEVALGCHYRLASLRTRLGLPEVTLGFVPGAGGTQRLPRLIGVQNALDVIVGGSLLPVERAYALGIVDRIVIDELVPAAVAFARDLVGRPEAIRKTSQRQDGLDDARQNPSMFDDFRRHMAKGARGYVAPYACVDAIRAAVDLPFEEGLAKERELFETLVRSDQSKTLRRIFFAEREVSKIPDVPRTTPTRPIREAAVIGYGTMGGGIAMNFANAQIPVVVLEVSRDAIERGMATVRKNYESTVRKGCLSQSEMDERMALISPTTAYRDIKTADADIVVEAVFEDMKLKKDVFRTLDDRCRPDTILATNTSTLDINEIAAATRRPDRVIGTHFFSPANVMRLMENIRGTHTSAETIATVMQLSKRLGKVGVLVGVCDGFVGNRMLYAYRCQADFLLEEGALPHQIDKAIYDFGMPMGPYQMADLAGLDISWRIRQRQAATRPKHLRYSTVADRICELGRFGQKTNAGWYRYKPGSRTPIPDPTIEDLIVKVSAELRITRRPIDDAEIVPRCLYPLINEGAKILSEGIAIRSSDIDIVWINGYGFPRYRGGPMYWADQVGISTIYETMQRLYDAYGERLKPAHLLADLARSGRGFKDL